MAEIKVNQKFNTETNLEEIDCIIPKEDFEKNFEIALENVRKQTTLPGFRKGNAPKGEVMKKKYEAISNEAVNLSIDQALRSMKNLEPKPLEPLNITSVNVNEDKDLVVNMNYIPMPKVEIGDVTKIKAKEVEVKEVTDEDIKKEIQNIWFFYASKNDKELKKEDFSDDKINEEFFKNTDILKDNSELKSLEDIRNYLEKYIADTYKRDAQMTWEKEIMDKLIDLSDFERIQTLVDKELNKRVEDYKAKFRQIGMDPEEYMEKSNLKEEDLKKEWLDQVERDIKLELLLQKYGEINNVEPTEEEIATNLENLDPATKAAYNNDPNYLRSLIRYYFINQKSYTDIIEKVKDNKKSVTSKGK